MWETKYHFIEPRATILHQAGIRSTNRMAQGFPHKPLASMLANYLDKAYHLPTGMLIDQALPYPVLVVGTQIAVWLKSSASV